MKMSKNSLAAMIFGFVAGFCFVSAREVSPVPADVKIAYDPASGNATLTWVYQPHNWKDGAEGYEAFSIAGFGDWILGPAVEKYENPHVKVKDEYPQEAERFASPQSWVVFCYDHVTNRPGQAERLGRYKPASGSRHFFAQAPGAGMVEDDHSDYLIRSVSQGGGTLAFDAFGIGGTSSSSGEKIMVMYSSRTSATEDMQELKTEYFDNSAYRSVQVEIPDDARYVALRYMVDLFDGGTPQEASYGVNVDNVQYYTEQPVPVSGFRVFRWESGGWVSMGDMGADTCVYLVEGVVPGSHRYGVAAVYQEDGSLSEIVPVDFELEAFPAVDTVTALVSGTEVRVAWTAPETGVPQSYRVVLKKSGGETDRQEGLLETSCRFTGVESGIYTAEVVAVYRDGESVAAVSSEFTVSGIEDARLELTVFANGAPVVADSLRLSLQNDENVYDASSVSLQEDPVRVLAVFESVRTGTYALHASLPFHASFDTVLVLEKALQQDTVRLKENVNPVSSLIYARNGKQVSAEWSLQPTEWMANAENYASFEYQDLAPWILSPAVSKYKPTDRITWPNEDQSQSWAVFTPAEVENIADAGAGWTAHGDRKVFISLSAQSGSTKDYLIREVETGGGELRFFVNGTSQAACSYDVLYSSTDSQLASFSSVEGAKGTVGQQWKEVVVSIPADARFLAIAHVSGSQTRGALMLDDIRYVRHSLDLSPKAIEIYVDGRKTGDLPGNTLAHVFSGLESGEKVLGVKAVYYSGETDPWEFTVDIPLLEDPENVKVSADSEKRTAVLSWTGSASALSYNIYLDGFLVCDTVKSTSYTFTDLGYGVHTAEVQAVFKEGEFSGRVASESFEIRDTRPVTVHVQLVSNGAPLSTAKVELWQEGQMKYQRTTYEEAASAKIAFTDVERGFYTAKAYLAYHDTVEKTGLDFSIQMENHLELVLVEHVGAARIVKADTLGSSASLEWELVPLQAGKPVRAKAYALYLDGQLQQTLPSTNLSHTFSHLRNGLHELGVKALFYSQEGEMAVDTVVIVNGEEPIGAPTDLKVQVDGRTANFTWTAPRPAPDFYESYLDDVPLASGIVGTSYRLDDLSSGLHTFSVRSCTLSDTSDFVSVQFTVEDTPEPAAPPADLSVRVKGDTAVFSYRPAAGSSPVGYRIYLDRKQVADAYGDTVYVFAGLPEGTYTAGVVAVYAQDSSEMVEKEFVVEKTVSNISGQLSVLRAYPNPVGGSQVNVRVPAGGILSLVDMQGRLLRRLQVEEAGLVGLDVAGLKSGLYFLRFENAGRGMSLKLVVR